MFSPRTSIIPAMAVLLWGCMAPEDGLRAVFLREMVCEPVYEPPITGCRPTLPQDR